MNILEIIMIGISLAMDAFCVSMCKSMYFNKFNFKCIKVSLYFSFFQMLMPIIGFLLGNSFYYSIQKVDHYIAFILLLFVGISMIMDSFNDINDNDDTSFKTMIMLSIATSIDALVVGLTLAFLNTNFILSISIIGIVTFIMCVIGAFIGVLLKNKVGSTKIGGIILIFIGLKILIEHFIT